MTTRGELIQEWRKRAGLNRAQVGRLVGTSRQNIDNLENDRVSGVPGYLPALARAMGYASTDDLLSLRPLPEAVASSHQAQEREETRDTKASLSFLQKEDASEVAHAVHLQPFTVPSLNKEELMKLETLGALPDRFVFELQDDAMGEHGRAGTAVLFHTATEAKLGAGVLIKDGQGDLHVRRKAQGRGGAHWVAAAPNRGIYRCN